MKDPQVFRLLNKEVIRQKICTNLIASENYISDDVMEALGSVFSNKYAEGYPNSRYYGGNDVSDELEYLCQRRALSLFGLTDWAVNVQALSGSPANLAVYFATVPIGGKIMGMTLADGGHLTHGHKVSFTGQAWTQIPYGVNEGGYIDYNDVKKIAMENKPNIIVAGFTAYPRIIDFAKFREIADECGALLMVDMSHVAGLVAGGVYPSPFPYADIVTTTTHKTLRGPRGALIFSKIDARNLPLKIDKAIFPGLQGGPHLNTIAGIAVALHEANKDSFKEYAAQVVKNAKVLADELINLGWNVITGGTDSHMILIDTWSNGISGSEASHLLEKFDIIVNKNMIPHDKRSAVDPSGIRLGTAAETTLGLKEEGMVELAKRINNILRS